MKRIGISLFATALLFNLASCLNTEKEVGTTNKDPRATYTPPAVNDRTRVTSKTVLNTVQANHIFSNPTTQDKFVLQLRGARVLSGQVHLIVTSSTGDTLRHEVMPARTLLDEATLADPQAATVRDKEIAILKGMNTYFAAPRFSQPAVSATAEQPAEIDGATWKALREDPTTVAFDFIGADGGERRLAYSRKLQKAVVLNQ